MQVILQYVDVKSYKKYIQKIKTIEMDISITKIQCGAKLHVPGG
jgi:hypothetical protein